MSNNLKISDLPQTNYISDDALIPIVQNRQNNVVTVKELSDKVGERHDRSIAQLWHELKKVGGGEFVPKTKNMLASLQWQLNELRKSNECKDKEQDSQLVLLNKALRDTVSKTIIHGNELAQLNAEMKIANANITYMQGDVKQVKEDTTYLKDAYTYLSNYVHFSPSEYWENQDNVTNVETIYTL